MLSPMTAITSPSLKKKSAALAVAGQARQADQQTETLEETRGSDHDRSFLSCRAHGWEKTRRAGCSCRRRLWMPPTGN